MPLRKVLLYATGTPSNNMASFTNVTARRLSIRKHKLALQLIAARVATDEATLELAEARTVQASLNDSRSLIDFVNQIIGASDTAGGNHASSVMSWNRGDFVLDTDDGIFMNGTDEAGAPTIRGRCNIFYED